VGFLFCVFNSWGNRLGVHASSSCTSAAQSPAGAATCKFTYNNYGSNTESVTVLNLGTKRLSRNHYKFSEEELKCSWLFSQVFL